ncbi:MAG: transcriptional repressor [Deltaproteobacteria bacterium]|nr:transcriptional repressor [Deltaproteobacteria bacterium]MBW2086231.1 transcriptional repressor [Deltaproteobacteria bacterium]
MNVSVDFAELLDICGIPATPHRLAVLKVISESPSPVRAQDILEKLHKTKNINKVTVYRILDLFVEKHLVERISSGDRSFRYGLATQVHGRPHAHFYCTTCGTMECLSPEDLKIDTRRLNRAFPGAIKKFEIRLDGTCSNCLKSY